ncbi:MAG TPA: hypothetical protein PLH07_08620 [Sulfurovum sp.]|nr:MAG: hypothetical protein B7Y23_08205 [Sulfurovum sp. 16-42-52]OYZ49326.1 MAG: hypothetical protein B7Y13_05060 [Sulfurovum sp. 24-42-9]HQS77971.1 hypothetical protein [Sulfurovum sp.]HQT29345.1 hypothetical protein [Sulfurovum sp.]
MAETHVISALTKKRSEVSGEIKHYEKLLKQSKLNLQSIDQTIHIFDETYDLRTIKAKRMHRERYFKTGEAKVLILDMLRESQEPLSTSELCKRLAFNRSLDKKENFDVNHFQKIIFASLERCENSGLVKRVGKDGLALLWQIKS